MREGNDGPAAACCVYKKVSDLPQNIPNNSLEIINVCFVRDMNEMVDGRFLTENKGIVLVGRRRKFLFEILREVLDGGECIGCVTDRASPYRVCF